MNTRSLQYPQSERLGDFHDEYCAIMTFLEWAGSKGYHLATYQPSLGQVPFMMPVFSGEWERIVHQYLEIDTDALDRERRNMIQQNRDQQSH